MSTTPSDDSVVTTTPDRSDAPSAPFRYHLAQTLAATLGETEREPIAYIRRIVECLGADQAQHLAAEAQAIYAGPGMLTKDGSRKRTLGGIFFHLAYGRATRAQKQLLRPDLQRQPARPRRRTAPPGTPQAAPKTAPQPQVAQAPLPPVPFEQVAQAAASWEAGIASKAMVKLVGRPLKVQPNAQGQYVAFTMPPEPIPALPSGLPALNLDTKYLVLVAISQWKAVEPALQQNPEDRLIIEGYGVLHPQFAGITVLAMSCRSLAAEQAKQREGR